MFRAVVFRPVRLAAFVLLSAAARAGGAQPASFLLFPEFDNRLGEATFLTVTNVNPDFQSGAIDLHVDYVDAATCLRTDRIVHLSPRDTFTALTSAHAPGLSRGYVFVVAEDPIHHRRIDFDYLIGEELRIDAVHPQSYSIQALGFQALTGDGQATDVNFNGAPDLDGVEYERAPNRFFVPRFFGQANEPLPRPTYASELILLQVLGGTGTTTNVGLLVYNDNEEVFSAAYSFPCWTRVRLLAISGSFAATFLQASNQNPNEVLGSTTMEAGWFELHGVTARTPQGTVPNPPVYGVLVDVLPVSDAVLPFVEHL